MPHKFLSILLLALSLCACAHEEPVKKYKLDGVVVGLDPRAHIARIDGQNIEGWMEAMTMEYPLKDPKEFETLHLGDHITATVFVQGLNYSVGEIHHVR